MSNHSIDKVTAAALARVELVIIQMLPKPTCQSKRPQWEWQVEQVKKNIAAKLNPSGAGLTITL